MSNYYIKICDLKKPVKCEGMLIDKKTVELFRDREGVWGLICSQILKNLEEE